MEDVVRKFLIDKLTGEIKRVKEEAEILGTRNPRCKSFQGEWDKLKNDLDRMHNPGREQLYKWLNLTAEWWQLAKQAAECCDLLKQQHKLNSKTLHLPFHDELSGIINQVKKDLQDSARSEQQRQSPPSSPEIYRWTSHKNPPPVRDPGGHQRTAKVHGFDDKLKVMQRLLLKEEAMAIGISGVAGVGKTVLAQEAYNHPAVKEKFLLRMWLCMSKQQKIEPEDPAKRMLRCLGFEGHVIDGFAKLREALRQQLNRGSFLIVLDDAWADEESDKAEYKDLISFLTAECGQGKVIVTSRSPGLEQVVGPNNVTQRLLPLEDSDSCWEIFQDALVKEVTPEMKALRPEIVKKCEGLPLMAKMLGKYGTAYDTGTVPHGEDTNELDSEPGIVDEGVETVDDKATEEFRPLRDRRLRDRRAIKISKKREDFVLLK